MSYAPPPRDATFYSLQKTSRRLIALLTLNIILSVIQASVYIIFPYLVDPNVPIDEEDNLILAFGSLAIVNFFILVTWSVFFLFWFYKAYKNFIALGVRSWKYSPRSAVIFFFVPFANLWIPYIIAKEIWNYSDPGSILSEEPWNYESKRSEIVKLWWITALLSGGLSLLASFGLILVNGLTEGVAIASSIFLILMVKEVTARQETKFRLIHK